MSLLLLCGITRAQIALPVISPVSGSYAGKTTVTITCSTPGAVIHYTIDGSTPTSVSPVYSVPFVVSASQTVRAIAALDHTSSVSANYVITATRYPYELGTSQQGLMFTWQAGSATPPSAQAVQIWDSSPCPPPSGVPTCHWDVKASKDQPWISVSSGTTGFVSSVLVTPLTVPGTYIGHITFTQSTFSKPSVSIPVTLVVTPAVLPPPPPTLYQAVLAWGPADGATAYNLYRSDTPGGPYVMIGTTKLIGFIDTTVVTGHNYTYVATAMYDTLESVKSNEVSVTVP